jgi:hypothetical protein
MVGMPFCEAEHVILALPKSPLQEIARVNRDRLPRNVLRALDAIFGFPMVKTFIIVNERWWEEDQRTNRYATRIPTRELRAWKSSWIVLIGGL